MDAHHTAHSILVVDDEVLVGFFIRDALKDVGLDVQCFDNAAAALAAAGHSQFSAAVVDVGLPGMHGDELAHRLRTDHPTLPIVLATGYDVATYAAIFRGDQYVRVMTKPFSENELVTSLEALGIATRPRSN